MPMIIILLNIFLYDTKTSEYIAVSGTDCRVVILSTDGWIVITELKLEDQIQSLQFSSNNEYLALASKFNKTYVVAVESWKICSETTHSTPVLSIGFSSNVERFTVGLSDGILCLLDPKSFDVAAPSSAKFIGEMDQSDSPIYALDWSSDGKYLAIGRGDASISIHESSSVMDNFFFSTAELKANSGAAILTLSFGVASKFLSAGGEDWKISIYDVNNNFSLSREIILFAAILSFTWSSDGLYLGVSCDDKKGVTIYDTISWNQVENIEGEEIAKTVSDELANYIDWSDDGRFFALAGDGELRIVDTATWKVSECIKHSS